MSMRPLDNDLVKITTKWATTGDVEDPEDNNITRTEGWGTVYSDVGGKRPEREVVNQRFAEWDALALEFVRHGVVRWDERVDYSHPALVMGNDNTLYESVGSSGPGSSNATNPVTDIVFTYWQPLIRVASPPNASETVRGLIQIATSTESAARTDALKAVPAAYVAAAVPTADTGTQGKVELATVAEAQAGIDATRAVTPAGLAAATPSVNFQRFTSSGSWSKPSGAKLVIMEVIGAGGGGRNRDAVSGGGGGGGGAYIRGIYDAAALPLSLTVTVGSGGSNGGAGGNSMVVSGNFSLFASGGGGGVAGNLAGGHGGNWSSVDNVYAARATGGQGGQAQFDAEGGSAEFGGGGGGSSQSAHNGTDGGGYGGNGGRGEVRIWAY